MRKYEGNGTLHLPWVSLIKGTFELIFKENGKTTLEFTPEGTTYFKLPDLPSEPGRFVGESTDSKYTVFIDKVYLIGASFGEGNARLEFDIFHPVRITYQELREDDEIEMVQGFSNFLFYGIEATQKGEYWVRDTVRCMLDGKEVCLIQLSGFKQIEEYLKEFRDVRTTCEFKVKGKYKDLGSLRELSQNMQFLCSLASGNYVTEMYEDIFKETLYLKPNYIP